MRSFLTVPIIAFVLLLPVSVSARARVQGVCEQGGNQVSVAGGAALSTLLGVATTWERTFPGCQVAVYLAGTTTLAVIYSDNSGTVTANPFTTSSLGDGSWFWYADNGRYDVTMSGGGIPTPFTRGDIYANDAAVQTQAISFSGNNSYTGTETHSGTESFSGPLNSTNLAAGNVANKPAASDASQYVSTNGNDSNDGRSQGTAKLTLAGALAALPTTTVGATTYSYGTINIAAGTTYTISSTLNLGPLVSVIGAGTQVNGVLSSTTINCTVNGDCIQFADRNNGNTQGGELKGFYLVGNNSTNGVGIHTGDIVTSKLTDVKVNGFGGVNGSCIWVDNQFPVTGAYERSVWLGINTGNNCTKNVRFTVNGGSVSFENNFFNLHMTVGTSQTGISLESGTLAYSEIFGNANIAAGDTGMFTVSGSAALQGTFIHMIADCNGCVATATAWNSSSTALTNWYTGPGIETTSNLNIINNGTPRNATQSGAIASVNLTAQQATITSTSLPIPGIIAPAGMYRFECYTIVTQQATTSATLPTCGVQWSDADSATFPAAIVTQSNGGANPAVGTIGTTNGAYNGTVVFNQKYTTSQIPTYNLTGYASVGATPMQYAVHIRLVYEGP